MDGDNARSAATCYSEALRQFPYAVECVLALVELGFGWNDLKGLYTRNPNDAKWLAKLVDSHQLMRHFDYSGTFFKLALLCLACFSSESSWTIRGTLNIESVFAFPSS